ncbi:MAG TPA: hypothetical protein VKA49_00480 [Flavitalea sp.]|nr:hypothetical protein [Flavitalea sp.]
MSPRAIFEQAALWRTNRVNNNLKIGMDYSLNRKTILGHCGNWIYNSGNERGNNISYLKSPSSKVDSIAQATRFAKEVWKNGSVDLNSMILQVANSLLT